MKSIATILVFLAFTSVFANNNEDKPKSFSITGRVVDNTENLTGVKVMLDNQELTVYTDFEGNFKIENVLDGEHILSFSLITYDNKEIVINPSRTNKVEVQLTEK